MQKIRLYSLVVEWSVCTNVAYCIISVKINKIVHYFWLMLLTLFAYTNCTHSIARLHMYRTNCRQKKTWTYIPVSLIVEIIGVVGLEHMLMQNANELLWHSFVITFRRLGGQQ